eukprot:3901733-Rhodomonas_salina.1
MATSDDDARGSRQHSPVSLASLISPHSIIAHRSGSRFLRSITCAPTLRSSFSGARPEARGAHHPMSD